MDLALFFITCYFKSQEYTHSSGLRSMSTFLSLRFIIKRSKVSNQTILKITDLLMCQDVLESFWNNSYWTFFVFSVLSELLSNSNSKVLTEIKTHMSAVTKQIKRGFHSFCNAAPGD